MWSTPPLASDFVELDFVKAAERMKGKVVIDGRNALDPQAVLDAGLIYEGIGRHSTPA